MSTNANTMQPTARMTKQICRYCGDNIYSDEAYHETGIGLYEAYHYDCQPFIIPFGEFRGMTLAEVEEKENEAIIKLYKSLLEKNNRGLNIVYFLRAVEDYYSQFPEMLK